MVLYLTQDDVKSLVDINDAITALEREFTRWSESSTDNMPRRRLDLPRGTLNVMAAALPGSDIFGYRAYAPPIGYNMLNLLSFEEKELIALIECGWLSTTRTGAASGVATKYLAREDAATLAVIGSGRTAADQLRAVVAVRPIERISVYSQTPENREAFAEKMAAELGIEVLAADTAQACVTGAEVVTATTNSKEPVLLGEWLAPGTHVNAVGANQANRREIDDALVLGADIVITDQLIQAQLEARALIELVEAGRLEWIQVGELGAVVEGNWPGRTGADQITLFHSLGLAFEDVAFGKLILEKARAAGVGREI
jgi:ornithine cyclodeaminase/alanine dehydrogenase-like protein (mu-crystallin family)